MTKTTKTRIFLSVECEEVFVPNDKAPNPLPRHPSVNNFFKEMESINKSLEKRINNTPESKAEQPIPEIPHLDLNDAKEEPQGCWAWITCKK